MAGVQNVHLKEGKERKKEEKKDSLSLGPIQPCCQQIMQRNFLNPTEIAASISHVNHIKLMKAIK